MRRSERVIYRIGSMTVVSAGSIPLEDVRSIRHTLATHRKSCWRSAFATASDFEWTRSFSYTCRM